MVTLRRDPRRFFFDRVKVQRAADRARIRALSKAGRFIRQEAVQSQRRRKGPSRPGSPPHAHEGTLRKRLFFVYDPSRGSVVVGPEGFGRAVVPSMMEFGASFTQRRTKVIRAGDRRGNRKARGREARAGKAGRWVVVKAGQRVVVKARPFMGPALDKTRSQLPGFWQNSIKGP